MRRTILLIAAFLFGCGAYAPDDDDDASLITQDVSSKGRRVCSWNIRRLGHDFDNRPKDVRLTARIIADYCDVIAVQEVMQTTGEETPGHQQLLAALGDGWDGVLTEEARPNTSSANSERYAFYFRKTAASLCQGWEGTRYVDDPRDAFLRDPAWTCLRLNARARDLLLVSYHAIYGAPIQRHREVSWIEGDLDDDGESDDVFRSVQGSRSGKADVVLVGDFNLRPTELANALPNHTTLVSGKGSTLNFKDEITDNLFDHVVVATETAGELGIDRADVLDVRHRAKEDTFFRSVSDHLPVRFIIGALE